MHPTWTLNETTFRPAEIHRYFGIAPGTQRQWRARGFLGGSKWTRAEMSIGDVASLVFIQACGKAKIALEVAALVAPAVAASARRYVITSQVPLPFRGGRADQRDYQTLETNLVEQWLGEDEERGARYVGIESDRAYPIKDGLVGEVEDDPKMSPITRLVIDCWAIGEAIKAVPDKDLVWISRWQK
jgi:hypothetical protein